MDCITITQREFDELPEYSCTIPTGTTIGKKWKRRHPYGAPKGQPGIWMVGQYYDIGDPNNVGIRWLKISAVIRLKSMKPAKEKPLNLVCPTCWTDGMKPEHRPEANGVSYFQCVRCGKIASYKSKQKQ